MIRGERWNTREGNRVLRCHARFTKGKERNSNMVVQKETGQPSDKGTRLLPRTLALKCWNRPTCGVEIEPLNSDQ